MILRGLASWIWSIRVVTKCIWDPWRQPTNLDLEGDQLWFVTPNFVKCQMLAPTYIDTRVLTQEFEGYILQIKSPKNWPIQANVRCWFKEFENWKLKRQTIESAFLLIAEILAFNARVQVILIAHSCQQMALKKTHTCVKISLFPFLF